MQFMKLNLIGRVIEEKMNMQIDSVLSCNGTNTKVNSCLLL